jgi:hypothetical protein
MESPFPGMDPYLEHPALWPDVHNSLIAAIRDDLAPQVAPRYYVGLERRVYNFEVGDMVLLGRPDISLIPAQDQTPKKPILPLAGSGVVMVEVPVVDEVEETFLEVRDVISGRVITIVELLSPANKIHAQGRQAYETKRESIFRSSTNLVEIDLLREGKPLPVVGPQVSSDYRILIRRSAQHPRAYLHLFSLREPIPKFELPLLPGDEEPTVDLNQILHDLYTRARFDLRLDYTKPPEPPLNDEDTAWAATFLPA